MLRSLEMKMGIYQLTVFINIVWEKSHTLTFKNMIGKFYIYSKSGLIYKVIQEAKMKNPTTGEWKDSVFYTDGDSAYCREKKDFLDKFKPVDNERK